jgi:hypothetical protein
MRQIKELSKSGGWRVTSAETEACERREVRVRTRRGKRGSLSCERSAQGKRHGPFANRTQRKASESQLTVAQLTVTCQALLCKSTYSNEMRGVRGLSQSPRVYSGQTGVSAPHRKIRQPEGRRFSGNKLFWSRWRQTEKSCPDTNRGRCSATFSRSGSGAALVASKKRAPGAALFSFGLFDWA